MRSSRDTGRNDRYDVKFTSDFEERVIRELLKLFSGQLSKMQVQLDRMEKTMAITAADVKVKLDALNAEVARNTDVDASIVQALDGNTQIIADLKTEIDRLNAAGGASAEELQGLADSADASLTTLKANNETLAAKVTQGTPAA